MRADIHHGQEHKRSVQGPDTEAQDLSPPNHHFPLATRGRSIQNMPCPIARSLARVGEWWSMLILRDALHGMTRFDQFQKSLGIAPNMLTRRLNALVEAGL